MTPESKITSEHLKRSAYLYIWQSSLHQVLENTESTERQYLELLDADRTRLQVELRHAQVKAQQHIASVRPIKALGGGWQENDAATRPGRASSAPAR